jgi:transcriptional regulator with XRE-family HTH domain
VSDNVKLGERIRALRHQRSLSQQALARRVGISVPYMSQIENGRRNPSRSALRRLADALEIPIERLLEDRPWRSGEVATSEEHRDISARPVAEGAEALWGWALGLRLYRDLLRGSPEPRSQVTRSSRRVLEGARAEIEAPWKQVRSLLLPDFFSEASGGYLERLGLLCKALGIEVDVQQSANTWEFHGRPRDQFWLIFRLPESENWFERGFEYALSCEIGERESGALLRWSLIQHGPLVRPPLLLEYRSETLVIADRESPERTLVRSSASLVYNHQTLAGGLRDHLRVCAENYLVEARLLFLDAVKQTAESGGDAVASLVRARVSPS